MSATMELSALERLKIMSPLFSVVFGLSLFKHTSYKDMHKILGEFE